MTLLSTTATLVRLRRSVGAKATVVPGRQTPKQYVLTRTGVLGSDSGWFKCSHVSGSECSVSRTWTVKNRLPATVQVLEPCISSTRPLTAFYYSLVNVISTPANEIWQSRFGDRQAINIVKAAPQPIERDMSTRRSCWQRQSKIMLQRGERRADPRDELHRQPFEAQTARRTTSNLFELLEIVLKNNVEHIPYAGYVMMHMLMSAGAKTNQRGLKPRAPTLKRWILNYFIDGVNWSSNLVAWLLPASGKKRCMLVLNRRGPGPALFFDDVERDQD
ncbi:hypothetical protein KC347_g254 [Hortaea werneckii]|nr:hypothetical protein KC347_g254 [Hortaea werneckii]